MLIQPQTSPLHVDEGADLQLSCSGPPGVPVGWFQDGAYIISSPDVTITTEVSPSHVRPFYKKDVEQHFHCM